MQTTEGLSWPDTLRWLAEHDGEDIEIQRHADRSWVKYDAADDGIFNTDVFRLAQRKPRVGMVQEVVDVSPTCIEGREYKAVELIPGMVVLERMPTEKEVIDAWNKHRQGRDTLILLNSLQVDIDE